MRSVLSANDGRLWLGTAFNGLARYDAPVDHWQVLRADAGTPRLSSNTVLALHQDRAGNIWIGTLNGLDMIDKTGAVHAYRQDPADSRSLAGNIVRAIHESADGTIWIGTQLGLNRFDGAEGDRMRFTRWLPRDGLPNGTIGAIGEDAMGRLWLSTNKGLAAFDRSAGTFRAFNAADGLQITEFNNGAYAALRDGRLAFGGVDGLTLFSPQAIVASRYPAPVVFTDVVVGDTNRVLRGADNVRMAQGRSHRALRIRRARFHRAGAQPLPVPARRFRPALDRRRHAATKRRTRIWMPAATVSLFAPTNHDGYWNEATATLGLLRDAAVVGQQRGEAALSPRHSSPSARSPGAPGTGTAPNSSGTATICASAKIGCASRCGARATNSGTGTCATTRCIITGIGELLRNPHEGKPIAAGGWLNENVHPDDLPAVRQRIDEHVAGAHRDARIRTSPAFEPRRLGLGAGTRAHRRARRERPARCACAAPRATSWRRARPTASTASRRKSSAA